MTSLLEGRRVLIVEDRYLIAIEMADQVQSLGGAVVGPANSVSEAIEGLKNGVDLALLDVNLDGESVFPVAEALEAANVPMVFLTGYDEEQLPQRWRDRPRLRKPVTSRALSDQLAKMQA